MADYYWSTDEEDHYDDNHYDDNHYDDNHYEEDHYQEDYNDYDDSPVYYLNCPFEEKDDAKALGAQFDGSSKRWFVPPHAFPFISSFNRWRPANRLYLECPYEEKDDAKKAGAKWDPTVKHWYVTKASNKVKRWLPGKDQDPPMVPSSALSSTAKAKKTKKEPSPAVTKKRGNAQSAATLRISDAMTVGQLQEECKTRGISGYSGKNKDYLLDQLGVGSIWQTMSMKNKKETKKDTPAKKEAAKASPATKTKATAKAAKATPKTAPSKAAAKKTTKSVNWGSLPKVSSSLTVAQLMHELLHRQPDTKGTSGKPKAWFLERLGEHSIWSTSPEASSKASNATKVSSSLTVAQLTHELMSRGSTTKGLSSKSKADLLKLVGDGSIWTTAPVEERKPGSKNTKRPPKPNPPASAKKKQKVKQEW